MTSAPTPAPPTKSRLREAGVEPKPAPGAAAPDGVRRRVPVGVARSSA